MHLLAAQPGGFVEDDSIITRLDQTPADVVLLSAADTTLALLAAQYSHLQSGLNEPATLPSLRLANLLHLRQPASIDLYLDDVLQHARLIIIDHLGGESYWPYGTERVVELCRTRKIPLAMFSGDTTEDTNLLMKSTVAQDDCRTLWRYLREGGALNAQQMIRFIGERFFDLPLRAAPPRPLPSISIYHPVTELGTLADWQEQWHADAPGIAVLFYRSHLQAGNTKVFRHLCDLLQQQALNPLPLALVSLKDELCVSTLQHLCRDSNVQLILNTTAFSQGNIDAPQDQMALLDDVPVLQLILSGGNEDVWRDDPQGLQPRDIAMHVALPEVDGRIITRAVSFKGLDYRCDLTQTDVVQYQPQTERMAFVVELARRWCQLRNLRNDEKKLALILASYPTKDSRLGNGVGLDTPASVIGILQSLLADNYRVDNIPADGDALMTLLKQGITNDPDQWSLRPALQSFALADYLQCFRQIPESSQREIIERWGPPEQDPMLRQQRFMIAGIRCGHIFVGIQPARGYQLAPMSNYHDPDLVPPHYYLAFYFWLRTQWQCDAIVHVGKHGNLEWLPGKSVALSESCWPDLIFGPLPHLYPFIVNDPGEGTQAKRRAQAVIIDHLMPPLTRAENYGETQDLERLVDEYYEALSLDRNRANLLRKQILQQALQQNLHKDLGLPAPANAEEEQLLLNRTDAYLCELKETQIRDGLHVFGQSPQGVQLRDTLLALARYPVGHGSGGDNSLLRALALDLQLETDFDPLDAAWEEPWSHPRHALLENISTTPWRTYGDARERLELLALQILEQGLPEIDNSAWPNTSAVMNRIQQQLLPALQACGEQELTNLLRGLAGRFVPPGPSGAPSRGRPDVLPTGRNFYSVDTRAIPTPTAWQVGAKSASVLIEKFQQENGDYPRAIGLSVWGTATMRTGGDDIAQAFALIGVKPKWAYGSHRVTDFEILPMSLLDRPRIDVTLRVSGFFRDAFANVIKLFDAAVQAIAELDEPADVNPIRVRIQQETALLVAQGCDANVARRQAGYRIFGSKPGAYGAGLQGLIDQRNWQNDGDLTSAYLNWGGYAYGQQEYGIEAQPQFSQRLAGIDLVLQNQDNREHDLLDSDDYYQFQGGMTAAVRHLSGTQPQIYFGDHSNPQSPKLRSLEQEISRVVRARVTNPKWIDGVKRHGYKGAFEMAATVDFLFAYDATARVVRDDQYAAVTDAYVNDDATRDFLQQHNPDALRDMCERLLEAIQRGLWQQPGPYQQQLEHHLLHAEQQLEGSQP
ncbi:MAG TPA: cobaltochelatase subunit CobN [Dongiaceae bacterium]|nr:cobaltochelatase subunit CobN [Dongiaceae bacterium]